MMLTGNITNVSLEQKHLAPKMTSMSMAKLYNDPYYLFENCRNYAVTWFYISLVPQVSPRLSFENVALQGEVTAS